MGFLLLVLLCVGFVRVSGFWMLGVEIEGFEFSVCVDMGNEWGVCVMVLGLTAV